MLTNNAYAKINLGLEVLGKRADGFHEIRTAMSRIELADELQIRPSAEIGVRWPARYLAPPNDLIRRAATMLRETLATRQGARIWLTKRIPMAAGLGGGSSDAAATLVALHQLWGGNLPGATLAELAASLGSDVPFFLNPGAAVASGRGEILQPLSTEPDWWSVVVTPSWDVPSKTATLYGALTPDMFTDGARIDEIAQQIESGAAPESIEPVNVFERVIDGAFPDWSALRTRLEDVSQARFWLSGAGPALYALCTSEDGARRIETLVRPLGEPVLIARLLRGDLRPREQS